MGNKIRDLVGHTFGRLRVVGFSHRGKGSLYWKCICECGKEKTCAGSSLKKGSIRSCGCLLRESVIKRQRLPHGEASFNDLMRSYKAHAKKLNLPFNLSKESFRSTTQKSCYYCGIPPKQVWVSSKKTVYGEYIYNGIDRVDSSKGYEESNVVPCCQVCNKAKRSMSEGEFRGWIHRVYTNLFA